MPLLILSLNKILDPQIDLRLKLEEVKSIALDYGSSSLPFLKILGHHENPFFRFLSLQLLDSHHELHPLEIKRFLLDPSLVIRDYAISNLSSKELDQQDLTLVVRDPENYFNGKALPIIQKTLFLMKNNPKYKNFLEEIRDLPLFFDFKQDLL